MRDLLWTIIPVAVVIYFMLNPEQFSAFVIWVNRLVGLH